MQVNVVLCCDDKFALPLSGCLRSVVENMSEPNDLAIVVIACGITPKSKDRVRRSLSPFAGPLEFVDVDLSDLSHLPQVEKHIGSMATYSRLLIPSLVDQKWDRAIYLDADTMVLGDLRELWDHDLRQAPIGAIIDYGIGRLGDRDGVASWRELNLDPATPYFNAGVMLMDLDRMRDEKICERALKYLADSSEVCWYDQEALNVAVNGRFEVLDQVWNAMHYWFDASKPESRRPDAADIRAGVRIRHFAGRYKPWLADPSDLRQGTAEYQDYLSRTAWSR